MSLLCFTLAGCKTERNTITHEGIVSPMATSVALLGGHHFLWNRGVMNFQKYLSNSFVTFPIWWSKMLWPPSRATVFKKHVTPNAAWKICVLGAISLNKIFIKICSHPIISWFFDPPISHEKILWPPSFFMPPPHLEGNDSPLSTVVDRKSIDGRIESHKVLNFSFSHSFHGSEHHVFIFKLKWI